MGTQGMSEKAKAAWDNRFIEGSEIVDEVVEFGTDAEGLQQYPTLSKLAVLVRDEGYPATRTELEEAATTDIDDNWDDYCSHVYERDSRWS